MKKVQENIDVIMASESKRLSSIHSDDLNPDIFLLVTALIHVSHFNPAGIA